MDSGARSREEARRLENKVAKVAAKKCSVEEVSTLHKELQQWLMSDVKSDEQVRLSTNPTRLVISSLTVLSEFILGTQRGAAASHPCEPSSSFRSQ
jgi:hypothetical protein